MRRIRSIVDVFKFCNPDTTKIVHSKTEFFETTHSKTAIILQHMGVLYYVDCITPGTTSIETLLNPSFQVTLRSVPKLIRERLQFLSGDRDYTDSLSKRMLYRALAATPELELLNELEGHDHAATDEILPWGITGDAQKEVAEVYRKIRDRENARRERRTAKPFSDEQPTGSSGGSDDRSTGKRKRNGR